MTAFDGHALNPGDASCFSASTAGIVTNICSGSRRYCVSGLHHVERRLPRSHRRLSAQWWIAWCFSNAVNEFGIIVSFTRIKSLNVVNQSAALALGTVTSRAMGRSMVCCDLSMGAVRDGELLHGSAAGLALDVGAGRALVRGSIMKRILAHWRRRPRDRRRDLPRPSCHDARGRPRPRDLEAKPGSYGSAM